MADLIDELRVLIPNCGDNGKKLNQSNVMSFAVEYIKNLHTAVVEMKQEIFFLKGLVVAIISFNFLLFRRSRSMSYNSFNTTTNTGETNDNSKSTH